MRLSGIHGGVCGLLFVTTAQICFAQLFPTSPDAAAKVVTMTGQVSVLRDSEQWALNVGDQVQAQQVILTGPDGYAKLQTSDGSTFEVYPGSNVIFRKNPGSLRDLLDLFVGRVKVHIQRLGVQPNPNRVMTPTAIISVRGTIFDVSTNDDDQTTIVSVEEGAVEVRHSLRPGAPKIVNAGESLYVYRDEPLAKSVIDRNELFHRIMRGLGDAAYRLGIDPPGRIATPTPGGPRTHISTEPAPKTTPSAPPPPYVSRMS